MEHRHGPSRMVALAVILVLAAGLPLAAQQVGRIVYLEGDVQLLRDGESRGGFAIAEGEPLLEMDILQTGFDGYVEVELSVPSQTTVRVRENSAYYIEIEGAAAGQTSRLRLLNGRVEMAVSQISRGSGLVVDTQTAVLGVRGTEFDVILAPDEATLFGIREGEVAIRSAGEDLVASAGTAVESFADRRPRTQEIPPAELPQYYAQWTETRLQAFRSGAQTFVRAYALRYQDTVGAFRDAYRDLMNYRQDLEQAVTNDSGTLGSDMRLRAEISPALIRMRSILPVFETTVYRLRELRRFHDQGLGRTTIGDQSSTVFFRQFAEAEPELLTQLSAVRGVFRLYRQVEERSFGGLPGDEDGPFSSGESLLDSMRF